MCPVRRVTYVSGRSLRVPAPLPGTGQHARSRKCENANPRPRMRERACQENDAEISLRRLGGGEELLFAVDFESGDRALTFG